MVVLIRTKVGRLSASIDLYVFLNRFPRIHGLKIERVGHTKLRLAGYFYSGLETAKLQRRILSLLKDKLFKYRLLGSRHSAYSPCTKDKIRR